MDGSALIAATITHSITLRPVGRGMFAAEYQGDQIVASSPSPELAACSVLAARGLCGKLVSRHAGSAFDASCVDISTGAAARHLALDRLATLKPRPKA